MNVSEVMTRDVVSVQADATILEACKLMLERRVSGLPVLNSAGCLVGIITERDFLRSARTEPGGRLRWLELITNHEKVDVLGRIRDGRVERIMTPTPVTTSEDAPIEDVQANMEAYSIKRLPVMRDAQLVGIVSRSDLLRGLMRSLRKVSEVNNEDALARQRLTTLERDYWLRHVR
jgi:CBS domain-containing protein